MNRKNGTLRFWASSNGTIGGAPAWILAAVLTVLLPALFSCGSVGTDTAAMNGDVRKEPARTEQKEPQPGDVKVVNGIEYIYGRNVRWMKEPYEPEYVWVRKDHYSPGLFESIRQSTDKKKEFEDLKKRIEILEKELKKAEAQP